MLVSMCLSIAFIVVDTCSVLDAFPTALPKGVQPFWKVYPLFLYIYIYIYLGLLYGC